MSKQTVMIIGLGLIGSSLAVCIKKEHPDVLIYGWDNSRNTNKIAIENKVVDLLPKNFDETAQNSDIIVLAVPVNTTQYYLQKLSKIGLKKETIITDTSSTKQEIVHTAKYYNLNFIGGHPMAGSHKSGIFACDENLFENAYYIFTPIKEEQKDQMKQLENLFLGTRAKYILLDPKEHDEITGMLSHLPHIIASGLVNQAEIFKQQHPRAMQLAAGGFRDITRIASSDPQMWTDILLNNREVLLQMLTQWQKEMSQLSFWLKNKKAEQLYQFF
ncbi:prephenate dehydrogenase [Tetragenococcus muriaticus PMC-11-5]|uniref:Prephenate dehydrogenase n=1 Tax=Tetragenococcus muriaticus PMC-11-5 TaxID=1302649 RepID=A0A091C470_9ENTE|nr:prephenate dehydrogenase [Tetragenococcus muriaticus PMC-11-5]